MHLTYLEDSDNDTLYGNIIKSSLYIYIAVIIVYKSIKQLEQSVPDPPWPRDLYFLERALDLKYRFKFFWEWRGLGMGLYGEGRGKGGEGEGLLNFYFVFQTP